MEGPPPPLGHPWHPNVGHNPLMDRGAAPTSLNHVPGFQVPPPMPEVGPPPPGPPPAPVQQQQQVQVEHHNPNMERVHVQHNLGPMDMNIGLAVPPPTMGVGMGIGMSVGVGLGIGMGMPFGPMFGGGVHSAGPLGIPRDPWNTPGLMGNPSSRYGSTVPGIPGLGFAAAEMPPPPPGIVGGVIPPFAPGAPLWAAGGGVPGVGAGIGIAGMGMGMGMDLMGGPGGLFGGVDRPAPAMITEASALPQPTQGDITQIPGGIPPGATHVESGEHTVVHVLKGPIYPWLNHGMPMEVEILHLSSVTGMNRFIEILNNNQAAEGMAVSECHEMVNGVWEKGQTFVSGDAMSRVLTIKDAGWDNTRNRTGGQSLHVYLHRV